MDEERRSLELARLLYGGEAGRGEAMGERMRRWGEAFEAWLEERKTRFSPKVGKEAHHAWKDFLGYTRKPPWEVRVEDIEAYIQALKKRGLSTGTIHKRLTGLAKFYKHCQEQGIDAECGGEFNPVAGASRPRLTPYEKANFLSEEEEAALLEAIRRDPSPTGKRDYALFLTLLTTGLRAGEVRKLRWGALEVEEGRARIRLERGGRVEIAAVREEAWEAIQVYLEASGRLAEIKPEDYVFAPGKEPLVREAGGRAEDWEGKRPLSADEVHYLLKLYAGWAGLKAKEITCHTLRHTAAMRQAERGKALEATQAFLGRKSAGKTKEYLERLAEKPKGQLRKRKKSLWKKGQIPARGPDRAQPRNHRALKHGLSARYLPELEWLEEKGIRLEGLDREILRQKVVMRRVLMVWSETMSVEEKIRLLKVMGIASLRLRRRMVARWKLREAAKRAEWDEALYQAIQELGEEWGLKSKRAWESERALESERAWESVSALESGRASESEDALKSSRGGEKEN